MGKYLFHASCLGVYIWLIRAFYVTWDELGHSIPFKEKLKTGISLEGESSTILWQSEWIGEKQRQDRVEGFGYT